MSSDSARNIETSIGMGLSSPGKRRRPLETAPVRDIDPSAAAVIKSDRKVFDQSLPNIDKFVGFNPYDTGVLQKKNSAS